MYGGGGGDIPGAGGGYWGQWDSHYGPMQRRPVYRQHQAVGMFGPTAGIRPRGPTVLPKPLASLPIVQTPERMIVPAVAAAVPPHSSTGVVPASTGPLYYDFNAPTRPNILTIRCAVQSIKADFQWNAPKVNKNINYTYKIKLSGGAKGDVLLDYPYWKTNASADLDPGNWYTVSIEAVSGGRVIAAGEVQFKSILCAAEMASLQMKAISFLHSMHGSNQMQEVIIFYRNKPPEYWKKIEAYDSIMRPYLKDFCGMPGSPINGEINGLFFSARLHNGLLPTSSPFGGQRLKLLCPKLFLPETHNMYFGDFYCNTHVHYVTVVICYKNSPVDFFCRDKLDLLDPFNNLFLQLTVDEFGHYRYFINNNVWVEVYFTGDVPLWWGEFDYTISLGQSKPNGIPNNKYCKICNLYPLEGPATAEEAYGYGYERAGLKRTRSEDRISANSPDADAKRARSDWITVEIPILRDHADENSTFHALMERARADPYYTSDPEIEEIVPEVVDLSVEIVDIVMKNVDPTRKSYQPMGLGHILNVQSARVKVSYATNIGFVDEKAILDRIIAQNQPEIIQIDDDDENPERKPDNVIIERQQSTEHKPDLQAVQIDDSKEKIDNRPSPVVDLQNIIDDIQSPSVISVAAVIVQSKTTASVTELDKSPPTPTNDENRYPSPAPDSLSVPSPPVTPTTSAGDAVQSTAAATTPPPPLPTPSPPPSLDELTNRANQMEFQVKKMHDDFNQLKNFLKNLEKKLFSLI